MNEPKAATQDLRPLISHPKPKLKVSSPNGAQDPWSPDLCSRPMEPNDLGEEDVHVPDHGSHDSRFPHLWIRWEAAIQDDEGQLVLALTSTCQVINGHRRLKTGPEASNPQNLERCVLALAPRLLHLVLLSFAQSVGGPCEEKTCRADAIRLTSGFMRPYLFNLTTHTTFVCGLSNFWSYTGVRYTPK